MAVSLNTEPGQAPESRPGESSTRGRSVENRARAGLLVEVAVKITGQHALECELEGSTSGGRIKGLDPITEGLIAGGWRIAGGRDCQFGRNRRT